MSAAAIALISYMESISTGQTFARRTRTRVDPDQELVAVGLANTASGLFRGMPVAGGFSRGAVNVEAGARTQLSGVVASAFVVLSLLVLTPVLAEVATVALAAVILAALGSLVDLRGIRAIARVRRGDLYALLATAAATLLLGPVSGLGVGVGVSMVVFLRDYRRPHMPELGLVPGEGVFRNIRRHRTITHPRLLVVRVDAPLSFVGARQITDHLAGLVADRPQVDYLVLDASAVTAIDFTGLELLGRLAEQLDAAGVQLHLAEVRGPAHDVLERADWFRRLEAQGRVHHNVGRAVAQLPVDASPAPTPAPRLGPCSATTSTPVAAAPAPSWACRTTSRSQRCTPTWSASSVTGSTPTGGIPRSAGRRRASATRPSSRSAGSAAPPPSASSTRSVAASTCATAGCTSPACTTRCTRSPTGSPTTGLTPYDVARRSGELKHVLITHSPDGEQLVRLVLRSPGQLPRIERALPDLAARLPTARVVTVNLLPGHQALLEGEEEMVLTEQDDAADARQRGGAAAASAQLLPDQHRRRRRALPPGRGVGGHDRRPQLSWDLYSGVGGFALHLAGALGSGAEVTGVELSTEAVDGARAAPRSWGCARCASWPATPPRTPWAGSRCPTWWWSTRRDAGSARS